MGSNFDLNVVAGGRSDPQERLWQKLAELETRLQVQERKREIVFTPVTFTNSSSTTVEWRGGRAWLIIGGRLGSSGIGNVNVNINGVLFRNRTTGSTPTGSNIFSGLIADDCTSLLTLGTGNVLTSVISSGVTDSLWNGVYVEWPYE
jgi:hypothetical protein